MGRCSCLASFLVLSTLALCGTTLAVMSPNGGGTLYLNNPYTIRWTSSGVTGSVRLVLFRGEDKVGPIASGLGVTLGQYSWTVGRLADGSTAPEGAGYRVRIVSGAGEEGISDFSDAPFAIAALRAQSRMSGGPARPPMPPHILVERPELHGEVVIGVPKERITWISPPADCGVDIGSTVSLHLVRQSDGRETPIDTGIRNAHGSNTYMWCVRPSAFGDPGDYRVRVMSSAGMFAESGTFKLVRENDFVAEIIPNSIEIRLVTRVRITDYDEWDFKIKARFRNGGKSQNDAVTGMKIKGVLYQQGDTGNWVRISSFIYEKRITVPAWGSGWKTVTFENQNDDGGVATVGSWGDTFIPRNHWKPFKFVATIDPDEEFPDADRDNNSDQVSFYWPD